MSDKINILFPVETINRELDFRLMLAALVVDKDTRVFVGQHNVLDSVSANMHGGIYVGKHIFKDIFPAVDIRNYVELKKRGFVFVHLDEEGAVYSGGENVWHEKLKVQFNPNYLTEDDFVCTWGQFQADFYRSRKPACESNIHATGHPRFDLYKSKYRELFTPEANALRSRFGDFVLFNSNLSFANNGLGLADMFSARNNFVPNEVSSRTVFIQDWAHTSKVLSNFVLLINRLSGHFPETNFVVRPHPGENWSFYKTIFNGFSNVHVVHEGPVAPWLLATRLLIHDGCTTGIEAYLGDTPVVSYKSLLAERHDVFLPDNVGDKCFTEEEVIDRVQLALKTKSEMPRRNELDPMVHRLMANFELDSFGQVVSVVDEAKTILRSRRTKLSWDRKKFVLGERIRQARSNAKSLVRPFFKSKQESYSFFKNQHFYGLDRSSIARKLERTRSKVDKSIFYEQLGRDLVILETD